MELGVRKGVNMLGSRNISPLLPSLSSFLPSLPHPSPTPHSSLLLYVTFLLAPLPHLLAPLPPSILPCVLL